MNTFKAAYLNNESDGSCGCVRLTFEDQSHLADEELVALAMIEAKSVGLDISEEQITVGEWTE